MRKSLFFFTLIIFVSTGLFAQSYNKTSTFRSYWQINASGGTSLFFGDIKQYKIWPVTSYENEWRFAGSLQLTKQISPVFGIRGQAVYGKLAGTRRDWNRYFEANYIEFNLNTSVSIRNIISSYRSKQFWDVYFIIGIGITNYNTEVKDLTTKQVVQKVGYGNGKSFGGRTLQGIMTGGLGFDFRLSDKWNVNLESANRIMNSDDLDGRTSGFIYDVYNYTSVGISYKFGMKKASKKDDDYNYYEKNNKKIKVSEYDEYGTNLIQPPQVDILVIEPVVVVPPVYKEFIVEQPIEPITPVKKQIVIIENTPITGVEYRVQISAKYNRVVSIQKLSNLYNLRADQIQENMYNGYFIYTIGSFATYEQAREKRNSLRGYNGISDAFIVAFKNGQRLNKLPQ
ncbi:MAG: hypothetical protein QM503_14120 [Bacteroidota bacterium]